MTVKNNIILKSLAFIFWIYALFGCQPTPHDVRQAGRDALENARIQLDSGNKAEALQLFKDAEHYGLLADDTLTVARAVTKLVTCCIGKARRKKNICGV